MGTDKWFVVFIRRDGKPHTREFRDEVTAYGYHEKMLTKSERASIITSSRAAAELFVSQFIGEKGKQDDTKRDVRKNPRGAGRLLPGPRNRGNRNTHPAL